MILSRAESDAGFDNLSDMEKEKFYAMREEANRHVISPDPQYTLLTPGFIATLDDAFEDRVFGDRWLSGRRKAIADNLVKYKGDVIEALQSEVLQKVRGAASIEQQKILDQMESKLRCILFVSRNVDEDFPSPIFCDNMVTAVQAHLARTPEAIKEVRYISRPYFAFLHFRPGTIITKFL
jgi:hypothetical protein